MGSPPQRRSRSPPPAPHPGAVDLPAASASSALGASSAPATAGDDDAPVQPGFEPSKDLSTLISTAWRALSSPERAAYRAADATRRQSAPPWRPVEGSRAEEEERRGRGRGRAVHVPLQVDAERAWEAAVRREEREEEARGAAEAAAAADATRGERDAEEGR